MCTVYICLCLIAFTFTIYYIHVCAMIINEYILYIVLIKRGKIQLVDENRKKWYGGRLHLLHVAPPLSLLIPSIFFIPPLGFFLFFEIVSFGQAQANQKPSAQQKQKTAFELFRETMVLAIDTHVDTAVLNLLSVPYD